jgi:hypothetical protein
MSVFKLIECGDRISFEYKNKRYLHNQFLPIVIFFVNLLDFPVNLSLPLKLLIYSLQRIVTP